MPARTRGQLAASSRHPTRREALRAQRRPPGNRLPRAARGRLGARSRNRRVAACSPPPPIPRKEAHRRTRRTHRPARHRDRERPRTRQATEGSPSGQAFPRWRRRPDRAESKGFGNRSNTRYEGRIWNRRIRGEGSICRTPLEQPESAPPGARPSSSSSGVACRSVCAVRAIWGGSRYRPNSSESSSYPFPSHRAMPQSRCGKTVQARL